MRWSASTLLRASIKRCFAARRRASMAKAPTIASRAASATGSPRSNLQRPLASNRLALEPQAAPHADEMFAVLSDPAIYEYENEPPASMEWLRERYGRLQSRRSNDGQQQWLNWVVRLRGPEPVGDVQATVFPNGVALMPHVVFIQDLGH